MGVSAQARHATIAKSGGDVACFTLLCFACSTLLTHYTYVAYSFYLLDLLTLRMPSRVGDGVKSGHTPNLWGGIRLGQLLQQRCAEFTPWDVFLP